MRYLQFLTLAVISLGSIALAYEPVPVKVDIFSTLALGGGHSFLHLQSSEDNQVTLLLSVGPLSSINFASKRITLAGHGSMDVDLGVLNFPTGQQTFHIISRVFDGTQNLAIGIGPFLMEPLQVSPTDITKISYEDAFLTKRLVVPDASNSGTPDIDLGGGVHEHRGIAALAFGSSLVGSGVAGKNYNFGFSPLAIANAFPCLQLISPSCRTSLNQLGTGDGNAKGTPANGNSTSSLSERSVSSVVLHPRDVANGFTIQGKFFLKLPGPVYQGAWAWEARAWQNVAGFWFFLGWSYVGGDGSWSIPVFPISGSTVRIEYQAANRFVQLQDASANVYTWGDNWTLTGPVTDIGGRAADFTVNGDLPGMDKLYVGATDEWVKFYNNGMNALRDQPIEVTYPNSLASGKCTSTDNSTPPKTIPWSCSQSADGKIWIIPAHGDKSVVQHEIAHSINSYYWNGTLAPGSGGKHGLTNCYNNGIGLIEGFADFMPYWVQFDRTASSPVASYYNISAETLPSNTCAGQTNEMRIAATFWDTYDYWNDGSDVNSKYDSLFYTNQAAMISLFLNNKKDTMNDYLDVMKSGQPDSVKTQFERIFRLNTIIN